MAGTTTEVKISELPVATQANDADRLEATQTDDATHLVSRSITVAQIRTQLQGSWATGISTWLTTPTSANLAAAVTDETGTAGALVFSNGPTLSNPVVGTQANTDNSTKAASTAWVKTQIASLSTAPSGPASGDLAGTYPGPTIKVDVALSGNPTAATQTPGNSSTRLATTAFVQAALPTSLPGPPTGTAGGDLSGTYPNPTIKPSVTNGQVLTTVAGVAAWAAAAGGTSVTISDTAPSTPSAGNLWWKSDTGQLYIYYTDPNTSQWVQATPAVQPAAGALTLYSEQIAVGGETQMNVTIPLNAKRIELEWSYAAASGDPAIALQTVESGVVNATANHIGQQLSASGTSVTAAAPGAGTSWTLGGAQRVNCSVKFMRGGFSSVWSAIVNVAMQSSTAVRYYQAWELDGGAATATTTGFRLTLATSSFNANSFMRAYVVV